MMKPPRTAIAISLCVTTAFCAIPEQGRPQSAPPTPTGTTICAMPGYPHNADWQFYCVGAAAATGGGGTNALANAAAGVFVQLLFSWMFQGGNGAAVSNPNTEQALSLNNAGVQAFERGDYAHAVSLFSQASGLMNDATILKNLENAQARLRLSRLDRLSIMSESSFSDSDAQAQTDLETAASGGRTRSVATGLMASNCNSRRATTLLTDEEQSNEAQKGFDTSADCNPGGLTVPYWKSQAPAMVAKIPIGDFSQGVVSSINWLAHLDGLAHDNAQTIALLEQQQKAGSTDPSIPTKVQSLINQQKRYAADANVAKTAIVKQVCTVDRSFPWPGIASSQPVSGVGPATQSTSPSETSPTCKTALQPGGTGSGQSAGPP